MLYRSVSDLVKRIDRETDEAKALYERSRCVITGKNDVDVLPCIRNVRFGVWGICVK